ncbi:MAG TPA: hypothetical protein VM427_01945 [Patescibacteria group bacterium]|nr:hypothetical protein [Patescibacteria group bacterium]
MSVIAFAVLGAFWFGLEGTPPRLGFEDTDDPSVMVRFIRDHPAVFVQAGTALLLMAVSLTIAVLAVAVLITPRVDRVALLSTSAFGLFAAGSFMFGGAVRIGSSGPLLHMAGLREEWGQAAYVAAQVASQAVLIGGIFALCVWTVGLSLVGARTKAIPLGLCILGIFPAFRIASSTLGPLGLLPDIDILWVISILSILGTIVWCVILGIVLLVQGFRPVDTPAPAAVAGT